MFNWFKKSSTSVTATILQLLGGGKAQHMSQNAMGFTKEGYQTNVVVFRCVDIIAKAVASIPVKVTKADQHLEDHPLQKLLDNPNSQQSYADFVEEYLGYRLITGNTFAEAIPDGTGMPQEINVWQPYNFTVVKPDNLSYIPRAYVWQQGTAKRAWDVDPITGHSELSQWKTFNPLDQWYGMSPIQAAAYAVDQHNAGSEWNLRMLQNDCSPSGVLSTEATMGEEQYERLKKDLEENWGGHKVAKKPIVLEGGMQWQQLSLSAKNMDWLNGLKMTAEQIAASFGVPIQLIPLPGSQTFANYQQAREAMWQDNAIPLALNLLQEYTRWLFPMYENMEGIELKLDLDNVPALSEVRKSKFETANTATFMTINEKREMVGLEASKEKGADEIWMPSGLMPLSEMEDPEDGEEDVDTTGEEDDAEGNEGANQENDTSNGEDGDGDSDGNDE